jgi:cytoskeletal protein CcmA (bactofilin family)
MFKYPKKPDGSPVAPSPFAENDVPDEWASPVQQPMASAPVDAGYFGAEESSASPFEMGAAAMAPTTTRNVLNYDVSVVGILRFTDDLLVDGSVEGEITSDGVLTVGANASIQAGDKNKVAVNTQSAIIHGKVVGDIVVTDRVELAATAEVVGDITAAKISIQEGAVFVGMCRVGNPAVMPATSAPAPKKAAARAAKSADANLLG